MNSYRSLVDNYDKTKRELREAESSIRRLTGRDPDEIMGALPGSGKRSSSASLPARSMFPSRKRSFQAAGGRRYSNEVMTVTSSSEEESSADESPRKKPSLPSTVVSKNNQNRSRRATIEGQNVNSKVKDRNRRMFGAVVKTLESFRNEEVKRKSKTLKRAEIERKVEAATEEERERVRREKEELFHTRHEKQVRLRCLEKKIERAECHEIFEKNQKKLSSFIMTKTKPAIFYLPKSHNAKTRKALEESRSKVKEVIKKHTQLFERDLEDIENWYKKDPSMPSDKENKCPKEENESQDVAETESESLVVEQEVTGQESDSNNMSSSNSNVDEENSKHSKHVDSLADQDFEPIYD